MSHDAEKRSLVEQSCAEFERELRTLLLGILRDGHLVDDAYQTTVMKALKAAGTVKVETVRGWLFRIAVNEARQLKRSASREQEARRVVWKGISAPEDLTATELLVTEEQREIVRKAIARLPENQRDVVHRRIRLGQSFAEIATELDRPLGTVLTWMRRSLQQLQQMSDLRESLETDE